MNNSFILQILATELGISQLSTSADVIVNLLDINDNRPDFSQSSYEIDIPENQLAGVQIGQVSQLFFYLGIVQIMKSMPKMRTKLNNSTIERLPDPF